MVAKTIIILWKNNSKKVILIKKINILNRKEFHYKINRIFTRIKHKMRF